MSAETVTAIRPDYDPGEHRVEPVEVVPIRPMDIAINYLSGPLGPQAYEHARRLAEVALIRPQLPLEHFQDLLEEHLFSGDYTRPFSRPTDEQQSLAA